METLILDIQSSKINWSSHWRDLGSQLGFTTDELDKITNEPGIPLSHMLRDWVLD